MTETSPAEPITAPRRRRPIVIAAGVVVVVLVALVAWISTRPSSPTAARDTALQGVLAYGGPDGWELGQDPAVIDVDGARWTQQDGHPVMLAEDSFTLVWSTSPATPQACATLATWAGKRLAAEAGADVTDSCPGALADKSGEERIVSSYATDPGEHGQYLFVARIGADTLYADLTYRGPAPNARR
ncbi:hypothetical protein [Actinoplanes sp. HUAS TT8]|uniref:hypothetical protein n=1 Tax=Actinoplanes sp. HUAS TT8 TaxID=3447453 RepID=UPI003F51AD80